MQRARRVHASLLEPSCVFVLPKDPAVQDYSESWTPSKSAWTCQVVFVNQALHTDWQVL